MPEDDATIDATRGECTLKRDGGIETLELVGAATIDAEHVVYNGMSLTLEITDQRTTTDATARALVRLDSAAALDLAAQLVDELGYRIVVDDGSEQPTPDADGGPVDVRRGPDAEDGTDRIPGYTPPSSVTSNDRGGDGA